MELLEDGVWVKIVNSTNQLETTLILPNNTKKLYVVKISLIENSRGLVEGIVEQVKFYFGECVPYCPPGYCLSDLCGSVCPCDVPPTVPSVSEPIGTNPSSVPEPSVNPNVPGPTKKTDTLSGSEVMPMSMWIIALLCLVLMCYDQL